MNIANIPVNIRFNPTTKIGSKMGGKSIYQAKWDPKTVSTTTASWGWFKGCWDTIQFVEAIPNPKWDTIWVWVKIKHQETRRF